MPVEFFSLIDESGVERIHSSALRVLDEIGAKIDSREPLLALREFGASVDLDQERARFSRGLVEQFIAESDKYDWSSHRPAFGCFAGIHSSLYMDPATRETVRVSSRHETSLRALRMSGRTTWGSRGMTNSRAR